MDIALPTAWPMQEQRTPEVHIAWKNLPSTPTAVWVCLHPQKETIASFHFWSDFKITFQNTEVVSANHLGFEIALQGRTAAPRMEASKLAGTHGMPLLLETDQC